MSKDTASEPQNEIRLVGLKAENFMGLKFIDIRFDEDGGIVPISGKNGQGKTAVLHILESTLTGAGHVPDDPIHLGATKASTEVNLNAFVVTQEITAKGRSLKVTPGGGGKTIGSPQALLDEILNYSCIDPGAFYKADEQKQTADYFSVFPIAINLETHAAARKVIFDKRTETNRDIKSVEAKLTNYANCPGKAPAQVVLADLVAQRNERMTALEERGKVEAKHSEAVSAGRHSKARIEAFEVNIAELEKKIEEAKSGLKTERAKFETLKADAGALGAQLEAIPAPTFDDIDEAMNNAEATNEIVRRIRDRDAYREELEDLKKRAAGFTAELKASDDAKTKAFREAQSPIQGVTVDDEGRLCLNGVRLKQCSRAERMRFAVAVAMAKSPLLKLILIEDASLLDEESMAIIAEMAGKEKYLVIPEVVSRKGDEIGIVISDGVVVADYRHKAAA